MLTPNLSPVTIKGIRYSIELHKGEFILMSDIQDLSIDASDLIAEGSRRLSIGGENNYDDSAMSYFIEERAHEYCIDMEAKGRAQAEVWDNV